MSPVHEIESAVSQLSRQELAAFRDWFFEFAAARDRQFEFDVHAGHLDALADEVPPAAMVAVLDTENNIQERAARGSREKFERVLSKVPGVEPEEHDRLSTSDAG